MPTRRPIDRPSAFTDGVGSARQAESSDVASAIKALQNLQKKLLDRLARGDASLVMTDATPVPPLHRSFGLAQESLGHLAVGQRRWDAVAVWLDRGGVLNPRTGSLTTMAGRIWQQILVPSPEASAASIDDAMVLLKPLRQRLLDATSATYRQEMLATLSQVHTVATSSPTEDSGEGASGTPNLAIVRQAACRAWVDEILRLRPLGVPMLFADEASSMPNDAVRQAVQAHLVHVEQRHLRDASVESAAPRRRQRQRL